MSTSVVDVIAVRQVEAVPSTTPATDDPRAGNARRNPYQFVVLTVQLALLLGVFLVYRVERFGFGDLDFFGMCSLVFAAFAIHYWLPFQWKEKFWVGISLAGMLLFLSPRTALALVAAGAGLYLVCASRLSYRTRISLVAAGFVVAVFLRSHPEWLTRITHGHSLSSFWPLFGAIFMFRTIIYAYDLRSTTGRPSLTAFAAYFFILPNYFFLLFPVIDYKTMRLGYYRRDIHKIAQEGINWIYRGTVQLLLYMIVFHVRDMLVLNGVNTLARLAAMMFLTFLLYLRVSGQFHIIVGMLHLFGYDLPETNHKYLLSRSLTDFWRRINIYWKDFMVKIVYFPTYFRLRKKNEFHAQMIATAAVFVVTWFLHSYQSFWLRGHFVFTLPDTLFWAVLGSLVMLNVWWDVRHPLRRRYSGVQAWVRSAGGIAGTMSLMLVIWSLWDAPSLQLWIDSLTWWRSGV